MENWNANLTAAIASEEVARRLRRAAEEKDEVLWKHYWALLTGERSDPKYQLSEQELDELFESRNPKKGA